MARQNQRWISVKKFIPEPVDNRGEPHHLTPPHVISKVSVRELTALRALFLVTVVRWVYREVVRTLTWPRICWSSIRSTEVYPAYKRGFQHMGRITVAKRVA